MYKQGLYLQAPGLKPSPFRRIASAFFTPVLKRGFWKKNYLDKWKDTDPEEWWPLYKSRFEEELKLPERRATLRKLWALLREGKNIGLLCFCPDYRYCHRTIIGNLLANQGVFVEEISPPKVEKPAGQYIQEAFIFG